MLDVENDRNASVETFADEDFIPNAECPCCMSEAEPLGALGRLTWYRCQGCGATFYEAAW